MENFNPLKYNKPELMENKYKEGDVVYAKEAPTKKLVVRRYWDRIYYCRVQSGDLTKEMLYFERELV